LKFIKIDLEQNSLYVAILCKRRCYLGMKCGVDKLSNANISKLLFVNIEQGGTQLTRCSSFIYQIIKHAVKHLVWLISCLLTAITILLTKVMQNVTKNIEISTTTTILWPFFQDHQGALVPEDNFCTLWCKKRLTEADTPTIRMGAIPSRLVTSAHLHQPPYFLQARCPSCCLTNSVKAPKATSAFGLGRRR